MQVWNLLHAGCWKCMTQKSHQKSPSGHHAQICPAISLQLRHISRIRKKLGKQQYLPDTFVQMVNFGPLAAEISSLVWGTLANFSGFCVLAALLHGTLVVGVSQTLWRWTEGTTYIWQGGHHVGHWPTFLLMCKLQLMALLSRQWKFRCTDSDQTCIEWVDFTS